MVTAIWWIRRDLRLHDQWALQAALEAADQVIPVFVKDPSFARASPRRAAFLMGGLRALDQALRERGSYLVIREGPPAEALGGLMAEVGATIIFAEEDLTPYARARDEALARRLPLHRLGFPTVCHPAYLVKGDGSPYRVFGAFRRAWLQKASMDAVALRPPPAHIPTPPSIPSCPLPDSPKDQDFPPGEAEALRRLREFTEGSDPPIYRYEAQRDRADLEGGSRLSPYLRFGMLSARRAAWAAQRAIQEAPDESARRSALAWLNELIWREFFIALMFHLPDLGRRGLREGTAGIRWRRDEADFAAWAEGRTGYPLVDAGMRQLWATGWMPNRVRMVAASLLTRTLGVDWRLGARWFMEQLVDGDPAVNTGNWQWIAGVGTDYASAFRVFNPTLQARRVDPEGRYIRRWVPELRWVPDPYLHAPWTMPPEVQREVGCRIGIDYPAPLLPRGDPIRGRKLAHPA